MVAPEPDPYNTSLLNRAVIDPDEIQDNTGQRYISYGSFFGGISIRKLSADGLTSDAASEQQIAIDNQFEDANFFEHNGYYYLFVSTSSCCDGPLSGYSVAVGRSQIPTGPFIDKQGVPLESFVAGGFISIAANGNKWVGPGGNVVFQDEAEQDYRLYHAIDLQNPYFDGYPGFTRRPALLDPIDWVDDWPEVRGGHWVQLTGSLARLRNLGKTMSTKLPSSRRMSRVKRLLLSQMSSIARLFRPVALRSSSCRQQLCPNRQRIRSANTRGWTPLGRSR